MLYFHYETPFETVQLDIDVNHKWVQTASHREVHREVHPGSSREYATPVEPEPIEPSSFKLYVCRFIQGQHY